jgi:hypothetical protein
MGTMIDAVALVLFEVNGPKWAQLRTGSYPDSL